MGLMHFVYTYLAINCQAIFKCPYGTNSLTARPKGAKFTIGNAGHTYIE
jgi:hypothetical protein